MQFTERELMLLRTLVSAAAHDDAENNPYPRETLALADKLGVELTDATRDRLTIMAGRELDQFLNEMR